MPATPAQAAFVRQQFRSVTVGPNASVDNLYGSLARKTSGPIETFFEVEGDADAMLTERLTLLGADRRRMVQTVSGAATGLGMTYIGATPSVLVIDDDRLIDQPALISEITVDFAKEETTLESWGGLEQFFRITDVGDFRTTDVGDFRIGGS